jgi:hypothetical protein
MCEGRGELVAAERPGKSVCLSSFQAKTTKPGCRAATGKRPETDSYCCRSIPCAPSITTLCLVNLWINRLKYDGCIAWAIRRFFVVVAVLDLAGPRLRLRDARTALSASTTPSRNDPQHRLHSRRRSHSHRPVSSFR